MNVVFRSRALIASFSVVRYLLEFSASMRVVSVFGTAMTGFEFAEIFCLSVDVTFYCSSELGVILFLCVTVLE